MSQFRAWSVRDAHLYIKKNCNIQIFIFYFNGESIVWSCSQDRLKYIRICDRNDCLCTGNTSSIFISDKKNKKKTNLQLYNSNSRIVAANTLNIRPQASEGWAEPGCVCQPDSLQKCAEARFCVKRRSGLHVAHWVANSGGSHKWNITDITRNITAISDRLILSLVSGLQRRETNWLMEL